MRHFLRFLPSLIFGLCLSHTSWAGILNKPHYLVDVDNIKSNENGDIVASRIVSISHIPDHRESLILRVVSSDVKPDDQILGFSTYNLTITFENVAFTRFFREYLENAEDAYTLGIKLEQAEGAEGGAKRLVVLDVAKSDGSLLKIPCEFSKTVIRNEFKKMLRSNYHLDDIGLTYDESSKIFHQYETIVEVDHSIKSLITFQNEVASAISGKYGKFYISQHDNAVRGYLTWKDKIMDALTSLPFYTGKRVVDFYESDLFVNDTVLNVLLSYTELKRELLVEIKKLLVQKYADFGATRLSMAPLPFHYPAPFSSGSSQSLALSASQVIDRDNEIDEKAPAAPQVPGGPDFLSLSILSADRNQSPDLDSNSDDDNEVDERAGLLHNSYPKYKIIQGAGSLGLRWRRK